MTNQAAIARAANSGRGFSLPLGAIVMDASGPDQGLDALRSRIGAIQEQNEKIVARADAEGRDLSQDDRAEIDRLCDVRDEITAEITSRERVSAGARPAGRRTVSDATATQQRVTGGGEARPAGVVAASPRRDDRRGGFNHFGDFALAVRQVANGMAPDQRLVNAATTYSQEGVGADGGFAVPPEFRTEIMSKVFGEDSLIGRCDQIPVSGNTLTMPVDMTTPWQTTGGIQSYWTSEAGARTQSKIALEDVTVKLSTLTTLIPVTDELLEDAPAMDAYLRRKAPEKMDFKLSHAIAWGSGAGMPLGYMNAPCLVSQAAESAQTADTINATNIVKMNARMPTSSRQSAVWLIHPDAEPQLPLMVIGTQPVYMPPGGLSDSPYGRLLGRPVIPHQICETVGDLGDVMFVDLKQYIAAVKSGGMRSDVSIHLWFDQGVTAYRFTIRVGGQPWWSTSTAMRDGASTQSPFVTLASR